MTIEEQKQKIKSYLHNATLIIKDNYSYLYLNSEQYSNIKKYELGEGLFVSAISLFALLNFISKVFYILEKGASIIVSQENVDEYESLKKIIKEKNPEDWKRIQEYYKKPRIGTINEPEAFILLIQECPIDFGIDKTNRSEINRIWDKFRNKLTHMISLSGTQTSGQMIINTRYLPNIEGEYLQNLRDIKSRSKSYTSFDIPYATTKDTFLDKKIDAITLQYIIKDKCYVERLNVDCENSIEWLLEKIETNHFDQNNYEVLVNWLESELYVS